MNNAQAFVQSIVGTSITFKPIEKGKDRPVQTIKFGEIVDMPISTGGTVRAFNVQLTFAGKRGTIQTARQISVTRALEYIGQAASSDVEYDEIIYVAPEPVVKEPKVKAEKPVKEKKVSAKEQKRLDAEAAAEAAQEGAGTGELADEDFPDDPFAGQD